MAATRQQQALPCMVAMSITAQRSHHTQGDYDGRGQQSCKCNFVHFYIEVRPPCSHSLCEAPTPLLTQLKLKLWLACSRELMSCVGRLYKDYLYLYNSLPIIPTPPLIMAVNIGEAAGGELLPDLLGIYSFGIKR